MHDNQTSERGALSTAISKIRSRTPFDQAWIYMVRAGDPCGLVVNLEHH